MAANIEKFDFDPEKLRQKYREERDKRLRPDGNDQYKEVKGDFSYFCLLYTSPSPRDRTRSRMPSSA